MQIYADIDRDSGVYGFEIEDTSITVWFKKGGKPYVYSYASAGQNNVEHMKKLAMAGEGLNAYINKHVKKLYVH
jgi:hypothetical protein